MYPAYHNGQVVLLNKHFDALHAGDVVAFRSESLNLVLVKRIVAVPGDTVQIADRILYVNDFPVNNASNISYAGTAQNKQSLTENKYFVLGDNYEYSHDSRYEDIGDVEEKQIIGKVIPNIKNSLLRRHRFQSY